MKTNGGKAFPVKGGMCFMAPPGTEEQYEVMAQDVKREYEGMTMRQWYAGQALAGYLCTGDSLTAKQAATWCFEVADAMIAEGEK